ncbi:hypothetical protein [Phyllobacterium sp. P30BS-XVII]|uniref:hypothetical protein n=1 Tax=Phyllobacterium sp. P30BS-XVII TaxID=2587046 RepID=UPI000DD813DE|nr:hypothetical protein [Phyllobacterium sp. P30BS-XVII]MBA8902418.1 hypothetical protein [Phyllobacterium sp. P30BS-XVII]
MRQPGFPQIVYQQADSGGGVASLAQRANRIIRGSQNMDLPVEQFLLNVQTDLGDHVYQKLMGYAATVHMLGLLAGAVGTPAEQKKVRDQLAAAIDAYLKTIKVDKADEGVYFETAGGGMDGGGGMALAWLLSKWFGMEGTQKQIERAGRVNHQVNQAMSQMVTDFIASLWNDFKKTWEEFWKNLDEKGLLFAVHKLQIDATFLAAEIGITIAISVVTEGAAALALGALRIVGERIGATVTRVVVKGVARAAEKTAMKSGILFAEKIADGQIDKKIIKEVFDEDKLGVGSKRSDVARRAEEQARPVEKPSGSGGDSPPAQAQQPSAIPIRPTRSNEELLRKYGGNVPSAGNGGEFTKWWNDLTPDELDNLWADKKLRDKIEDRVRYPGDNHEWLMTGMGPKLKRLGFSMDEIKAMTTPTKEATGPHGAKPDLRWRHTTDEGKTGEGSGAMHRALRKEIEDATSRNDLLQRLGRFGNSWLDGGVNGFPPSLRDAINRVPSQ